MANVFPGLAASEARSGVVCLVHSNTTLFHSHNRVEATVQEKFMAT